MRGRALEPVTAACSVRSARCGARRSSDTMPAMEGARPPAKADSVPMMVAQSPEVRVIGGPFYRRERTKLELAANEAPAEALLWGARAGISLP